MDFISLLQWGLRGLGILPLINLMISFGSSGDFYFPRWTPHHYTLTTTCAIEFLRAEKIFAMPQKKKQIIVELCRYNPKYTHSIILSIKLRKRDHFEVRINSSKRRFYFMKCFFITLSIWRSTLLICEFLLELTSHLQKTREN